MSTAPFTSSGIPAEPTLSLPFSLYSRVYPLSRPRLSHAQSGFHLSVGQDHTHKRSPDRSLTLTPPPPGGRADRGR